MTPEAKLQIIDNYQSLLRQHGDSAEAAQWSPEGQLFRFRKLVTIGDLGGRSVLDLGCGLGALFPFLIDRFNSIDYTGIDIVPDSIAHASMKYPGTRFLCRDILTDPLDEQFDYVLISGPFNNQFPGVNKFLEDLVEAAFGCCRIGLAFNFTSSWVNFTNPEMAYHDPAHVLHFCLRHLSRKVSMHHHYERCDVVVFVYR
jgi:SAM-dependent methyltransferase